MANAGFDRACLNTTHAASNRNRTNRLISERYIVRVNEVCPDLLVEAVTLDVQGQNNDILVVNDEVIFRFPKYDECVNRLEIETAILIGIQR